MGSAVDWTQVILALIAAGQSILISLGGIWLHRQLRTPSGGRVGELVERTHELTEVATVMTKGIHDTVNGEAGKGPAKA